MKSIWVITKGLRLTIKPFKHHEETVRLDLETINQMTNITKSIPTNLITNIEPCIFQNCHLNSKPSQLSKETLKEAFRSMMNDG